MTLVAIPSKSKPMFQNKKNPNPFPSVPRRRIRLPPTFSFRNRRRPSQPTGRLLSSSSLPPSLLWRCAYKTAHRLPLRRAPSIHHHPPHRHRHRHQHQPTNRLGHLRPSSPPTKRDAKMRMSCNGCRVLRKGCSDACTIRPCLQWIKSPEAQANATVFLAKFYGRAGLLNLLAAPPADNLRPAVFRSLLYEACGRIVNPVYGSVGLLWSGQWQACQAAVEAVLKGHPVVQVDAADAPEAPPLLGARTRYDIRHVARDPDAAAAADLLRVARGGRKRAASSSTASKPASNKRASLGRNGVPLTQEEAEAEAEEEPEPVPMVVEHDEESAGSHDDDRHHHQQGSEDTDVEGANSHAHSHVSQAEPDTEPQSHHAPTPPPPVSSQQHAEAEAEAEEEEEVGLELTLGLEPLVRQQQQPKPSRCDQSGLSAASSLICLRLQLPA